MKIYCCCSCATESATASHVRPYTQVLGLHPREKRTENTERRRRRRSKLDNTLMSHTLTNTVCPRPLDSVRLQSYIITHGHFRRLFLPGLRRRGRRKRLHLNMKTCFPKAHTHAHTQPNILLSIKKPPSKEW